MHPAGSAVLGGSTVKGAVRRRTFVSLALAMGVGGWLVPLLVFLVDPIKVSLIWSLALVPSLIFSLMVTFFWTLGWHSAIRYTATHVSVTNALFTTTVAWADVKEVDIDDGLTIHLRDGKELGSIQFGGSLIGALTGYPTHRRARRMLQAALKQAPQQDTAYAGPVQIARSVTWRPPTIAAAVVYASFLAALSTHL